MTAPDLHPELTAHLEVIATDPEAAASSGFFPIDNRSKATWAVAQIGKHTANLAESIATYQDYKRRLDEWIEGEMQRCERYCGFLREQLRQFHEARRAADPFSSKTIRLPSGVLKSKAGSLVWDFNDAEFIAWATEHRPDLLCPRSPTIDKNAVKKAFDGMVGEGTEGTGPEGRVVTDEGEIVPGVLVLPGEVSYTVHPHEGAPSDD